MKIVINNKRYNTETARVVGAYESGLKDVDPGYLFETLYQNRKTGEFFIHGIGGPSTKYARPAGGGAWLPAEKIIPLSLENARIWAKEHLAEETFEEYFGAIVPSGTVVPVSFRITEELDKRLRREATARGMSKTALLQEILDKALRP